MIVVLTENGDYSTDLILEWIKKKAEFSYCRINTGDHLIINRIEINDNIISIRLDNSTSGFEINLSEVNFFLCRRGLLGNRNIVDIEDTELKEKINFFLNKEQNITNEFIVSRLNGKLSWGNSRMHDSNKLVNLAIAVDCGFKVPHTILSQDFKTLQYFCDQNDVITKPISEIYPISNRFFAADLTTRKVNSIGENNNFFLSQLQEEISKWIEIRVFVSYDTIFSMAIFSQGNVKTEVDYRNYDRVKMNRMIPFNLPDKIKEYVLTFMQKIRLDTGSIDLILSPNKDYYFLEVNPEGVIEMLSEPCNYYLEKRIAEQILERMSS